MDPGKYRSPIQTSFQTAISGDWSHWPVILEGTAFTGPSTSRDGVKCLDGQQQNA